MESIARERGHEIAAILDEPDNENGAGVTEAVLADARVAIDFSTAEAVRPTVTRLAHLGVNAVVGTTGWEGDREAIEAAVREAGTGLLHSPNFSIGMLSFIRIVEAAARVADRVGDYDVALAETHHRHKVDHPGGTARRLAELLVAGLRAKSGWSTELAAGEPIDPEVLQVAVSRVGEVPGIHTVNLEGPDDRIELRHEARSRNGFARGAVLAAEWLEGRAGVFTMSDLMADLLGE